MKQIRKWLALYWDEFADYPADTILMSVWYIFLVLLCLAVIGVFIYFLPVIAFLTIIGCIIVALVILLGLYLGQRESQKNNEKSSS